MASNLLTEEGNHKNVENSCIGNYRWKSQERVRSKSGSCFSVEDMKYYNCGKKVHMKKDWCLEKKDKKHKEVGRAQCKDQGDQCIEWR